MLPHLPLHKVNKFNSVTAFSSPIVSNKEISTLEGHVIVQELVFRLLEVSVLIF